MILFNLIFTQNSSDLLRNSNVNYYNIKPVSRNSLHLVRKISSLAYVVKTPDILSQSKQKIAKEKFIRQTVLHKIFNTYYKEAIFLSIPNKISDKYVTDLNYLNINKNQNIYKYLVSRFSKSLFDGSIISSLSEDKKTSLNFGFNIQYMWHKGFTFKNLFIFNGLKDIKLDNSIRKIHSSLGNNINLSHLPLFTVSNNLGQMIISEPPEEFNLKKGIFTNISNSSVSQDLYQGWFFINYEDAQEYMTYINESYGLKPGTLRIFTCNLQTLYKLMGKFHQKLNFRLIPDLKEVSQLIKKYRYYSNLSFHENQKYGSTYFQGQPLYLFQLLDNHLYTYTSNQKQIYNLVFTNYDTALYALQKFSRSSSVSSNVKKPSIIVYNLEHFIKDDLGTYAKYKNPFLLVPSQKSYQFTKKYQLKKKTDIFYDYVSNYVSFIQLWSKRILWSLTSRQP